MPRKTDPETVIRSQVVLEEHDVAADGRFAVVVRRFVQGDRYRSHLWLVPLASKAAPIQLTSGGVRDSSPRISPDGSAVAFRRTREASRMRETRTRSSGPDGESARLRILPLRDGRPTRPFSIRTPRDRSVGEVAWAPDGRRLALTMDAGPPRFIVGPVPRGDAVALARRITRIDWREDETGHVDFWSHLHVVDARPDGQPRPLTSGDWGVSTIAWSPDGRSIAFTADPRPDADLHPRTSIWRIDVAPAGDAGAGADAPGPGADARPARGAAQAEPREVLSLGGSAYRPAWSPDGRWISAIGYVPANALDDTSPEVVVGPSDGSRPPWPLAPDLDRPIGAWLDTDLFGWTASSRVTPAWVDAGTLVAPVSDRGRAAPWRFDVDPETGRPLGRPERLVDGDIATHSLAVTGAPGVPWDRRVTLLACLGDRPVELMTVPLAPPTSGRSGEAALAGSGEAALAGSGAVHPRVRTTMGGRWARGLAWPEMRVTEARGVGGGGIETWVASPRGAGTERLPTIVDIHGGPLGAWAPAPHLEVVLLAAAGYRVILPNIRGSAGYGRDWIRPQLGDWGGVDADDVHAAVDHVIELGLADPDRLGVFGLSYGGFLVNWLVGTTNRFRAGVSEAGVTNQVSDWANSDTGVEYNRMALLGEPLDRDGVAKLWRQSPLANAAAIRTPLLILQGEADQRCPPTDNEQLFVALRVLGRTVEYVLYPEEAHVYMAAGRPDRRIDRMQRVIDWFDRHVRERPG